MESDNEPPGGAPKDEPLRLVHHHPGRLRVRAHALLGQCAALLAQIRVAMEGVPGVSRMDHSPRTGSLLIEYEPGLAEPDAILARVVEAAGFDRVVLDGSDRDHRAELVDSVLSAVRGLNAVARELTGGRADLRELVPAALLATSIYSLITDANSPRTPRCDTALNWSYSIFMDWHRRAVDRKAHGETTRAE
jgi:hypothetical protein